MRRPVNDPYRITTDFGVTDSYAKFGRHSGIDYAVALNAPVYAPSSGQLTNVVSPTGGNMVVIFDGNYYHRLMHNNSFVRQNGYVQEGDVVARAGTTGLSTGVHVHHDINTEGIYPTSFSKFVNPLGLISKGDDMSDIADHDFVADACVGMMNLQPETNQVFMNNIGLPKSQVLKNILGYQESRNLRLDAQAYRAGQSKTPSDIKPYDGPQLYVKK